MNKIAVIGIGSPFGNDTLGWQVIEPLQEKWRSQNLPTDQIQFIAYDRPGMQLLALLENIKLAILIDAIDDPHCVGELRWLNAAQLVASGRCYSSHDAGVYEALSLGNALGDLPEELHLAGICIDPANLAPIAQTSIDKLINSILNYLHQHLLQLSVT